MNPCCGEVKDRSMIEALNWLLTMVAEKIRSSEEIAETVISKMLDALTESAAEFLNCLTMNVQIGTE